MYIYIRIDKRIICLLFVFEKTGVYQGHQHGLSVSMGACVMHVDGTDEVGQVECDRHVVATT
jgi:hypothetical protein